MAGRSPYRPLLLALIAMLAQGVAELAELPFVPLATADVIDDPQVQREIDGVASSRSWESYYASMGVSELHANFVKLASSLDEPRARALCWHESPVVRAYAVQNYVANWPGHARRIYPLLLDSTQVDTLDGCMGGRASIAKFTVDSLCAMESIAFVQDVLLRATLDRGVHPWIRTLALRCLASSR